MQRFRVQFFGPINLIHRDGTSRLKQWWRRKTEHPTNSYVDGIIDEEGQLWMSHSDARNLEADGLQVEAVMHPGTGPDGLVRLINTKKEKFLSIIPV